MIEVKGLHKQFGKVKVLDGIDLEVGQGKIIAILGPNGSGKTTLLKSMLGMVTYKTGDILFDGI